jgi:beta-glucosidase
MSPGEPGGDTEADVEAAEPGPRYTNRWFLEPALRGRYPDAFPDGLPAEAMGIADGDLERARAPLDVIGVNLYVRTRVVASDSGPLGLGAAPAGMGGGDGARTDFGWEVWPDALYDMLMRVTRDYDRPVLEITENGCSYADGPDTRGVVNDQRRIDFYRGYLAAVARAIEDGADVRGYHAWTLLDNFEWTEGFAQRFGLVYTDFPGADRTLKQSGVWYGRVAAENGFET